MALMHAAIQTATTCAGAARLDNGSIVTIGQPFVGAMSAPNAAIHVGFIPTLGLPNDPTVPIPFELPKFNEDSWRMTLSVSPPAGWDSRFALQASTHLTDWISIYTNAGNKLPVTLSDPEATNFQYRFYRIGTE
jgi:hypothetical protein